MATTTIIKFENPWDVQSLYDFQYFNCPTCSFKNPSKYDFVHHTFKTHPESVDYLRKISDGSFPGSFIDILPLSNDSEFYNRTVISNKLKIELQEEEENYYEEINSIDDVEEVKNEESSRENEEYVLKCESCDISFSVEQHRKNPHKCETFHEGDLNENEEFSLGNEEFSTENEEISEENVLTCQNCESCDCDCVSMEQHLKSPHKCKTFHAGDLKMKIKKVRISFALKTAIE